jgi:hypothetical protein
MAAAFDFALGSNKLAVNNTTLAVTTTQASTSGAKIFVAVYVSNLTNPSCADNQGNTYALDKSYTGGGTVGVHLFSTSPVATLPSGAVVTITLASGRCNAIVFSATGVGAIDAEAAGRHQVNQTTWASNAMNSTVAGDFLIGVSASWGIADSTHTAAGGWTDVQASVSQTTANLIAQYRVGGAPGSETAGGTWTTSQGGGAEQDSIVIGYLASASGPAPNLRTVRSNLRLSN